MCSSDLWGKTPPCVDRIIASGIKKVVISTIDPNPMVNGRSVKKLISHAVEVKVGLLKEEAARLNEIFFINMKEQRPFVAVKTAQSLDGKIATKTGKSKWITAAPARNFSHKLRDKYDGVLVGANTVIKDNPCLEGARSSPYKIVFDSQLSIPLQCNLINKFNSRLIIFFLQARENKQRKLEIKGIRLYCLRNHYGSLNIKRALVILYDLGIKSIFVDGGSYTIGSFFDAKLVDKIYFFYAPKIIGGQRAITCVGAKGVSRVDKAAVIRDIKIRKIGGDYLLSGYPQFN